MDRTGLPAHSQLQGAGGEDVGSARMLAPSLRSPGRLSPQGIAVPGEEAELTPPQGIPPACWWHSTDSWPAPALTFSLRSCQLSCVPSTGLCLWEHSALLFTPQPPGWAGTGQGTGAGKVSRKAPARPSYTANNARSTTVRAKGGHQSPAGLPLPHVPMPWLPCPQGGVVRVSLHQSLKMGPQGPLCTSTLNLKDRG